MNPPADTFSYFFAGYAVIFGLMAIYIGSLVVRWRSLRKDETLLNELDDDK
jgi:hypothetical protein